MLIVTHNHFINTFENTPILTLVADLSAGPSVVARRNIHYVASSI